MDFMDELAPCQSLLSELDLALSPAHFSRLQGQAYDLGTVMEEVQETVDTQSSVFELPPCEKVREGGRGEGGRREGGGGGREGGREVGGGGEEGEGGREEGEGGRRGREGGGGGREEGEGGRKGREGGKGRGRKGRRIRLSYHLP